MAIDNNSERGKSPRLSLDKGSPALKEKRRDTSIAFRTRSRLKLRGNITSLESCVLANTSKLKKTLPVEDGGSLNVDGLGSAVTVPSYSEQTEGANNCDEDWENVTLDNRATKFLPCKTEYCTVNTESCVLVNTSKSKKTLPAENGAGSAVTVSSCSGHNCSSDCDDDWENLTLDKRTTKVSPSTMEHCAVNIKRVDLTPKFEFVSKLKYEQDRKNEIENEKLNRAKSNVQTHNLASVSCGTCIDCNTIVCSISAEPKENITTIGDCLCSDDIQLVSNHLSPCQLKNLSGNAVKKRKLQQNVFYTNYNCLRKEITESPPSTPQHRVKNATPDSPENSPLYDMPPPSTLAQKRARRAKRQIQLERWRKYEEKKGRQERYERRHRRHSRNKGIQIQNAAKTSVHIQWKTDLEKVYIFSPCHSDYCYD